MFSQARSRSYWLSRYLRHRGWHCGHEEARHVRSLDDVRSWLSLPRTGTVETAAGVYWRVLRDLAPDARVVVVRRDLQAVWRSAIGTGAAVKWETFERNDMKLAQIAKRWPGALSVTFEDLSQESVCAAIVRHCTGLEHDPAWFAAMQPLNLQADVEHMWHYAEAYRPQLERAVESVLQWRQSTLVVPVVKRDAYTIGLEHNAGVTMGHITVHRWSAQVHRRIKADIDALFALHGGPIFSLAVQPYAGDIAKWCKWHRMVGFEYAKTLEFMGEQRPLYVRWR